MLPCQVFEGSRMHQFPSFIVFGLVGPLSLMLNLQVLHWIVAAATVFSLFLCIRFGDADFNSYPQNSGLYRSGMKKFRLTKGENEVWVFYPVNRRDYLSNLDKRP